MAPSNNETFIRLGDCEEKLSMLESKTNNNGWEWKENGLMEKVRLGNGEDDVDRLCFKSMIHRGESIEIGERDCVLVAAGEEQKPFIAKVAKLFENPEDREMMVSLLWYYRQEDIESLDESGVDAELFASKHWDVVSVDCIEDKCFVMTFNEFCRYQKMIRIKEEGIKVKSVVPELIWTQSSRARFIPQTSISTNCLFMCRKVYDFKRRNILKLKQSTISQKSRFSKKYLNHNCDLMNSWLY